MLTIARIVRILADAYLHKGMAAYHARRRAMYEEYGPIVDPLFRRPDSHDRRNREDIPW